jgi:hypothetical protein
MRSSTREVLQEALKRYGAKDAASFFECFGDRPSKRGVEAGSSRQARHARIQRQRSLAVAGTIALIHENPEYTDVLLDPSFARFRPYSAATHTRLLHLAEAKGAFPASGVDAVWSRTLPLYIDLARRVQALSRDELLVLHSLQVAMSPGFHVVDPRRAREFWTHMRGEFRRYGVLDNASSRLWAWICGSHTGACEPHVDWLLDSRTHDFDLADTLCFVRRDHSEEVLDLTAAIVRGDTLSAWRWRPAIEEAPVSSWLRLAEYVRSCSRMNVHCLNEGQVLMVLSWVEDIQRHLSVLGAGAPDLDRPAAALRRAFNQIESVQILEKNRFLRVLASAPKGRARERLAALWQPSGPRPAHDG